jgi:Leucine-rich repeat (LRR) protein
MIKCLPNLCFPKLKKLNCANNYINSLPIMELPELKYLNCYGNIIKKLPKLCFPNLTKFNCSNNQIEYLSDIDLPKLQHFLCWGNNIQKLSKIYLPALLEWNCSNNEILSIPDDIVCPQLEILNIDHNLLQKLPDNMNFPNLIHFSCSHNLLKILPNMKLLKLKELICSYNDLISLPENMDYPFLEELYCNNNFLQSLPNINFPMLKIFYCSHNILTSLPEQMFLPKLEDLYCNDNQLTTLPLCILQFRELYIINYDNNNIVELPLQISRFINRMHALNIYNDEENIHNTYIQKSFVDSINNITTRQDVMTYNKNQLINYIIDNKQLTEKTKSILFEFLDDETVHTTLLLTFSEVLWYTLQTIINDFNVFDEIFKILNQEILDAECKCFTGRICRVVNCLNGFSPLVNIQINDVEQIGNIIILIKHKLELNKTYTVELHKIQVEKELLERGYNEETINLWINQIED